MNKPRSNRKVSARAQVKEKPLGRVRLSQEELSEMNKRNRNKRQTVHRPSEASMFTMSQDYMRERSRVLRSVKESVARDKERALLESTSLGDLIK